ncbi:hypothetical protein LTR84_001534 [Exophiala bonariae]|uniref:Ribosomal protein S11 n=1 Tax=Exophiala bonariae TaxID=1690606 RepID=A0AAV9NFD7_9EURO|nr:hypothetical protein LTR84_001534 [Exophiala bonariae]
MPSTNILYPGGPFDFHLNPTFRKKRTELPLLQPRITYQARTSEVPPIAIMARPVAMSTMCRSCRRSYLTQAGRANTQTPRSPRTQTAAERWGVDWTGNNNSNSDGSKPGGTNSVEAQDQMMEALRTPQRARAGNLSGFGKNLSQELTSQAQQNAIDAQHSKVSSSEPYHLNVYAHRHNMHITFTEPSRDPILSMSAGDIGLRKAQRSTYDAAYQLAAYFFRKMAEKQWRTGGKKMTTNPTKTISHIQRPGAMTGGVGIEVILRGYGPGREAFQKALLGTEGRQIKPLISRVTDATRLKFGGTRSHKVRRLG